MIGVSKTFGGSSILSSPALLKHRGFGVFLFRIAYFQIHPQNLKNIYGLFEQVQLDESRTCVFWNDDIDLPSDAIYEYGKVLLEV